MDRLFGSDGIRGILGEYPLTDGMIFKLGKAAAYLLLCQRCQEKTNDGKLKIIIGKDAHFSAQRIEVVLASGISSCGVDVLLAGEISPAGLTSLIKEFKADMAVMISASAHKAEENEIRFFSHCGDRLAQAQKDTIEEFIFNYSADFNSFSCKTCGSVSRIEEGQIKQKCAG